MRQDFTQQEVRVAFVRKIEASNRRCYEREIPIIAAGMSETMNDLLMEAGATDKIGIPWNHTGLVAKWPGHITKALVTLLEE